jgi:hypothetical protein
VISGRGVSVVISALAGTVTVIVLADFGADLHAASVAAEAVAPATPRHERRERARFQNPSSSTKVKLPTGDPGPRSAS